MIILLLYTWNNDSIIYAKAVPSQISVIKKYDEGKNIHLSYYWRRLGNNKLRSRVLY